MANQGMYDHDPTGMTDYSTRPNRLKNVNTPRVIGYIVVLVLVYILWQSNKDSLWKKKHDSQTVKSAANQVADKPLFERHGMFTLSYNQVYTFWLYGQFPSVEIITPNVYWEWKCIEDDPDKEEGWHKMYPCNFSKERMIHGYDPDSQGRSTIPPESKALCFRLTRGQGGVSARFEYTYYLTPQERRAALGARVVDDGS